MEAGLRTEDGGTMRTVVTTETRTRATSYGREFMDSNRTLFIDLLNVITRF